MSQATPLLTQDIYQTFRRSNAYTIPVTLNFGPLSGPKRCLLFPWSPKPNNYRHHRGPQKLFHSEELSWVSQTADPWTTEGKGRCTSSWKSWYNLESTFCISSSSVSSSLDSTSCGLWSAREATIEKDPQISGSVQFQPALFKGQLYRSIMLSLIYYVRNGEKMNQILNNSDTWSRKQVPLLGLEKSAYFNVLILLIILF